MEFAYLKTERSRINRVLALLPNKGVRNSYSGVYALHCQQPPYRYIFLGDERAGIIGKVCLDAVWHEYPFNDASCVGDAWLVRRHEDETKTLLTKTRQLTQSTRLALLSLYDTRRCLIKRRGCLPDHHRAIYHSRDGLRCRRIAISGGRECDKLVFVFLVPFGALCVRRWRKVGLHAHAWGVARSRVRHQDSSVKSRKVQCADRFKYEYRSEIVADRRSSRVRSCLLLSIMKKVGIFLPRGGHICFRRRSISSTVGPTSPATQRMCRLIPSAVGMPLKIPPSIQLFPSRNTLQRVERCHGQCVQNTRSYQ